MRLATLALPLAFWIGSASAVPAPYAGVLCYFPTNGAEVNASCLHELTAFVAEWQRERDWQGGPPPRISPDMIGAPGAVRPWSGVVPQVLVRGHGHELRGAERDNRISVQRAAAVARALGNLGLPADIIRIEGVGSTAPLVSSPGIVPQNRNVRITFLYPRG